MSALSIDLATLIKEKVGDIEILEKTVEDKKLLVKVRFSNGHKSEIKLNRFVDCVDFAYCLGLFGGEGTKKWWRGLPFEITNSDPDRIKKVMGFLKLLGINGEKFSVRLQVSCNPKELKNGLVKKLENFWIEYLDIPADQFEKPNIINSRAVKRNKSKFGTIRLRVNSTVLAKLFIQLEKDVVSG